MVEIAEVCSTAKGTSNELPGFPGGKDGVEETDIACRE
jgi:hypothetical protein